MKICVYTFILATLWGAATAATCKDDPHFRYLNDLHDCDWILTSGGCEYQTGDGQVVGQSYCPVTCDRCDLTIQETSISTDQLCYYWQEDIVISFENEEPQADDWVGLYEETSDSSDLGDPWEWHWLCGHRHEECKVRYDTISFSSDLPPGTYKAVLARRNHGGPYSSYAKSLSFQVTAPGQPCTARRDISAEECANIVQVDKADYAEGEDIVVGLEHCDADKDDFVAIYDADTDLEDIKGDANYRLWMFTCGTQRCHQAVDSNVFAFGKENNVHTWPLPPGTYQAHLVKRGDDSKNHEFGSAAVSTDFTVHPRNTISASVVRHLEDGERDCIDEIVTLSTCYEEGDAISVGVRNECTPLTPDGWIGFYNDEPNKSPDDMFFGDPLLWIRACNGDCNGAASTQYNFKVHQDAEEHEDFIGLLPSGTYRAILVGTGYRHGGPYAAQLVSNLFEVHPLDQPCQLTMQDTPF